MTKIVIENKKEINSLFNYLFKVFAGRTEGRCGPQFAPPLYCIGFCFKKLRLQIKLPNIVNFFASIYSEQLTCLLALIGIFNAEDLL